MIILEYILLIYFSYVSFYSFILAIAAYFYKDLVPPESNHKSKIAVLIPAYKEDNVILDVAAQATNQNYPSEFYDIIVIADSLMPSTIERLKAMPIKVVEAVFDKSTKVKSLTLALNTIGDDYDYALILDADNIMEKDFLHKMNNLLALGYRAIQGQRTSKNQNTSMSILDGLSETINNFIHRQGTVAIGLSSSLIGSGMIFEYRTLKEIILSQDSVGGFDREMELKIIKRGIKIFYAKGVLVFDEKVESIVVFENQRKRWMSSHLIYLKKYFFSGCKSLFKGDISFFNSAILRNIQLPRLINLGLLIFFTLIFVLFHSIFKLNPWFWVCILSINMMSIALCIPKRLYTLELLKSIILLPRVFFKMFSLLFSLKGANKTFIHTPHSSKSTDIPRK